MTNRNLIILAIIGILVILGLFFVFKTDTPATSSSEDEVVDNSDNNEKTLEETVQEFEQRSGDLTEVEVRPQLIGSWNSLDREGYVIEFTNDGIMRESLGPTATEALWDLVSFEEGPNNIVGSVSFSQDGVFLKQGLDEGKSNFFYKIVQADQNRLVLIYLHEGGILGFERVR